MRSLIFDIDDTLYDLEEPLRKTYNLYYSGVYDIDVDRLFQYVRFYSDEFFDASITGEITMDDMYAYRLQKAFGEFQIDLSREDALRFQKTYASFQKKISMTDSIKKCLDQLKNSSAFLGIISNGTFDHQMDKVHILGLTRWFPEDHILISESAGFSKPDVRIFKYAEKKWNLDHSDIWYIGDTFKNDIAGPKAAGWHTIWYNHRQNPLPDQGVKPDYIVSRETSLIQLLLSLVY